MAQDTNALTVTDVALRLNCDKQTVIELIRREQLVGFKVGRDWRILIADLDAYIDAQKEAVKRQTAQKQAEQIS